MSLLLGLRLDVLGFGGGEAPDEDARGDGS